jgi:hypothetical protein
MTFHGVGHMIGVMVGNLVKVELRHEVIGL